MNITVVEIAKVCHQVNKAYCSSIGDDSQLDWDLAPEWAKKSATNGVIYHVTNPDANPSDSHETWMAEKVKNGWVYGEVKDPDATPPTHPSLVKYEDLETTEKSKDYIFRAIVHVLGKNHK